MSETASPPGGRRRHARRAIVVGAVIVIGIAALLLWRWRRDRWQCDVTAITSISNIGTIREITFHTGAERFVVWCAALDSTQIAYRVVQLKEVGKPVEFRDLPELRKSVLAVNGGYFDERLTPVGLMRIDGREVSPLAHRTPLSGALVIDSSGSLSIRTIDDPAIGIAPSIRQAGPFLIDPGGKRGIHEVAGPLAERTVIAIGEDGQIRIISTTPVSLFNLATCLENHPEAFGMTRVERALNLDGGPSAAFVAEGFQKTRTPRKAIRDILVAERKSP